jgi:lysozyme
MEHSENCTNLVKECEGLYLRAYLCPADVLTIGYGHTGHDVFAGMIIDENKAIELLNNDLKSVDVFVSKLKVSWNQNQFDAIVSFAFNVGGGALKDSTLLRKARINVNDPSIAYEFSRWNKGGGKILPGLVKRRKKESDLYFK